MRLLLRRHIPKLGTIGDIVEVKAGHGRNYLIPEGIAVPVTVENLRQIEIEKLSLVKVEQERCAALDVIASEIQRNSITIKQRANDNGELYGSVNERMISESYAKLDIEFDYRCVVLVEAIKSIGTFNAEIHLDKERNILANAKIIVMEEKEKKA
jgi:large subunit ribosomal protein L9